VRPTAGWPYERNHGEAGLVDGGNLT